MTMTADAKFWDGVAEKYAARPVDDVSAFERKQSITREHLSPESTVLELGCGTGSLALALAPHARHIHAMDISSEMIRIANRKRADQQRSNVTFHQGTLDSPHGFTPGQFDCVWAYSILHLVPDRERTLAQLFELLKPGGVLISSNVCLADSWVPYGPVITVMRWFGKAPFVRCYDRKTIRRELVNAGFDAVRELDVGAVKTVAFIVASKPG